MSKTWFVAVSVFVLGITLGITSQFKTITFEDAIDECKVEDNRSRYIACISSAIATMRPTPSTRELMNSLERLSQEKQIFKDKLTLCHDVSHAVGQFSSKAQMDVGTSLSECSSICTAGCYHGVIEGYIAREGEIPEGLMQVCEKAKLNNPRDHEACLHGLGHGVANILGADLNKSLLMCDELEPLGREFCGGGVIMELYEPGSYEHVKLEFPSNIIDLCETLWGAYKTTCLETAGSHELGRSGDFGKAIEVCSLVPKDNRDNCAIAVGAHLYHSGKWLDQEGSLLCNQFEGTAQIACIKGLITTSLTADPSQTLAKEMCKIYDSNFNEICE